MKKACKIGDEKIEYEPSSDKGSIYFRNAFGILEDFQCSRFHKIRVKLCKRIMQFLNVRQTSCY